MEDSRIDNDTIDTSRYRIPALTADNYYMWSRKMEFILRGKGLWGIVAGTEQEPQAEAEKAKYARRKDVAITNIILTIDDSCSAAVINLRDPKRMWDTLKEMYEAVSEARVDAFLVQFQNLRMTADEKVMEYVNRISELENKLASVGHTVSTAEKRRVLLRGLRDEFAITAGVVRATNKTFSEAVSQLVVQEAELDADPASEKGPKGSAALKVQNQEKCDHCGRKGHTKDKCYFNPDGQNYRPKLAKRRRDRQRGKKSSNKTESSSRKNNENEQTSAYLEVSFLSKYNSAKNSSKSSAQKWYIDSGASAHMCNDPSLFKSVTKSPAGRSVSVGDGEKARVTGSGTIICTSIVNGTWKKIALKNVLCVPTLMCNLISVSKIRQAGFMVIFDTDNNNEGMCQVSSQDGKNVYLSGVEQSNVGLYEAVMKPAKSHEANALMSITEKQQHWHQRLGHVSGTTIRKTLPLVKGIKLEKVSDIPNCAACKLGKSTRSPRPPATDDSKLSTKPLELVHTDLVGPLQNPSIAGRRYFMPLYDDASGLSLIRFLKSKVEAGEALKEMILELERVHNCKVKKLLVKKIRSDNAKEFISQDVKTWLASKGIVQELIAPYSPESNGKAERLNRTLMDMARTMLIGAPHIANRKQLWAEAVNAANYLRNRMFTTAANYDNMTPYEIVTSKKPDLSYLRQFGAKSYVHIPKARRQGKFGQRAEVGYCVGFASGNAYRIFMPDKNKVIISRDVDFDETPSMDQAEHNMSPYDIFEDVVDDGEFAEPPSQQTTQEDSQENQEGTAQNEEGESEGTNQDPLTYYPSIRQSSRPSKPVKRYVPGESGMIALVNRMGTGENRTPVTYDEAVKSPEKFEWIKAMNSEISELNKKTWRLVELPPGIKPIKNKWVYFNKKDASNNITRRRARLVAKGFSQKQDIDYNEVFAPVAKYSTVRFMFALAAQQDLEMLQIDVKAAFLNGELEEEIYMQQPEGFVSEQQPNAVYKLLRALYGLKQASRAWNKLCDNYLRSIGCIRSSADSSLYTLKISGQSVFILVYVDDMLLLGKSMEALNQVATLISKRFEIRIEPSASKFLGILIDRNQEKGQIKIHSTNMIRQLLITHNMENSKSVSTPLNPGIKLVPQPQMEHNAATGKFPYRELVGSLLHLANTTPPDIAYSTSLLSRFLENPGKEHWNTAKHVLRYLQKTVSLGIVYKKKCNAILHGYTDADYANDPVSRKSVSGFVFKLAGGLISWRSKKQSTIAQSTLEAEFIAMSYAVREAIWLRRLMSETGIFDMQNATEIFGDNQGAMDLAYNDVLNERTKHIEVKYQFSKQKVEDGTVVFNYVRSADMTADIMTKSLQPIKHNYFVEKLGMIQEYDKADIKSSEVQG